MKIMIVYLFDGTNLYRKRLDNVWNLRRNTI